MPRLRAQSRKTPGRLRMISFDSALAAAVRMINGIHSHTANRRTLAMPARPPGLAIRNIFVIQIADLADGSHAVNSEAPHLARGQFHQGQISLFAKELCGPACGPHHLSAFSR